MKKLVLCSFLAALFISILASCGNSSKPSYAESENVSLLQDDTISALFAGKEFTSPQQEAEFIQKASVALVAQYVKKNHIFSTSKDAMLNRNDSVITGAFIETGKSFDQPTHEAKFVKTAPASLVAQYVKKNNLFSTAQGVMLDRNDAVITGAYVETGRDFSQPAHEAKFVKTAPASLVALFVKKNFIFSTSQGAMLDRNDAVITGAYVETGRDFSQPAHEVKFVKTAPADLVALFVKKHFIFSTSQGAMLDRNDAAIIRAYVEAERNFAQPAHEAKFIQTAPADLVVKYIKKNSLSDMGQRVLFKRTDIR